MQNAVLGRSAYKIKSWPPSPPTPFFQSRCVSRNTGIARGLRASQARGSSFERDKSSQRSPRLGYGSRQPPGIDRSGVNARGREPPRGRPSSAPGDSYRTADDGRGKYGRQFGDRGRSQTIGKFEGRQEFQRGAPGSREMGGKRGGLSYDDSHANWTAHSENSKYRPERRTGFDGLGSAGRSTWKRDAQYPRSLDNRSQRPILSGRQASESTNDSWDIPSQRPFQHANRDLDARHSRADSVEPNRREDGALRDGQTDMYRMSIPYTTAASIFLYGQRAVQAALKAGKRKAYTLYLRRDHAYSWDVSKVIERAEAQNAKLTKLPLESLNALVRKVATSTGDQAQSFIHDNVCLEVSPGPEVPVTSLGVELEETNAFALTLSPQSREEIAINGQPESLHFTRRGTQKPFIIWLHGVVDMRNVGAIMRSAVYFGVDIILSQHGTASSGFHRPSAGASEFINILRVDKPEQFIKNSQAAGWKFYSAVPPGSKVVGSGKPPIKLEDMDITPTVDHPCCLVLGNEDLGLPNSFAKLTDFGVTITGMSHTARKAGVDSLNVSVAASMLMERFIRQVKGARLEELKTREEEKIF